MIGEDQYDDQYHPQADFNIFSADDGFKKSKANLADNNLVSENLYKVKSDDSGTDSEVISKAHSHLSDNEVNFNT